MRNRQKSSYRQCWIPSTLKDKIVKFLFMFKPSKNPLTRAICWKSLRSVSFSHSWLTGLNCFIQASCWSCCWIHEVSIFDGLACGAENIYFWVVNTSLLNKPRRAKWWNFQEGLCLYNFHFLAIWKWMFSRNCKCCQSNNVCSHIWNKLHWKLLQSPD